MESEHGMHLRGGQPDGVAGPKALFLFTGEGAHSAQTDLVSLRDSPNWSKVAGAVQQAGLDEVDGLLSDGLGSHAAPRSPVITTVVNLLNYGHWHDRGWQPDLTLGHSVGEVAAACAAGRLSIAEAIKAADVLGRAGAMLSGAMAHATLPLALVGGWTDGGGLCIAAINGAQSSEGAEAMLSITLCGQSHSQVDEWVAAHHGAKRLTPPHPWHHPGYLDVEAIKDGTALAGLPVCRTCSAESAEVGVVFLSATRGAASSCDKSSRPVAPTAPLDAAHWRRWLSSPVYFHAALEDAASLIGLAGCYTIEMGAHPALSGVAAATLARCGVAVVASALSMRRGQPDGFLQSETSKLQSKLSELSRAAGVKAGSKAALSSDAVLAAVLQCVVESTSTLHGADPASVDANAALMDLGIDSDEVKPAAARDRTRQASHGGPRRAQPSPGRAQCGQPMRMLAPRRPLTVP